MKKTRILASLLCLMMVVCALPVLQVSADAVYADSIAEIMDVDSVTNWKYSRDLTTGTKPADATVTGTVNYTSSGVEFPAGAAATFKLAPATASDPWEKVNATVLKAKFSNGAATEKMFILAGTPDEKSRHYLTLYPTYLTTTNGSGRADFNFGTDWFELLIYTYEVNHQIYVKNAATNGKWLHLKTNPNRGLGSENATGFSIQSYATNTGTFLIDSVEVYQEGSSYSDVAEIMGGAVTTNYSLEFDNNFEPESFGNNAGSEILTVGATLGENGYNMSTATGVFSFTPHRNYEWSPLNGVLNNTGESAFVKQALYFKLRHNAAGSGVTVIAAASDGTGRIYRTIAAGSAPAANGNTGTIVENVIPDVGSWAEYLFVPTSYAGGYDQYVKSATLTNGQWVKICSFTAPRDEGSASYATAKLQFSAAGKDIDLKSIKTYQLAVSDANTLPAGETCVYYGEDFDATPEYSNLAFTGGTVENGILNLPTTTTNRKFSLNYGGIPVGGYADFKVSNNGTMVFDFMSGEKALNVVAFKSYVAFNGRNYYAGVEGGNEFRIWRIVNTGNGYNIFTKMDGDSGWYQVAVNGGTDSTSAPQMDLALRARTDNGTGNGKIDYVKIYGPAPSENEVLLLDGYGTTVLEDGDIIGYGTSFHTLVNSTGKFLVVSYKGDDMVKAQIFNGSENGIDQHIGVAGNGADTVKVFLWDNLTNLNRLSPVVTLEL